MPKCFCPCWPLGHFDDLTIFLHFYQSSASLKALPHEHGIVDDEIVDDGFECCNDSVLALHHHEIVAFNQFMLPIL